MTQSIFGNFVHMEKTANAIYKVTNTEGRKMMYFMFTKLESVNSKWPSSRKVSKGWVCVAYPCGDNVEDKLIKYEYADANIGDIEHKWFNLEGGVKNYQQIKYDPYIDTQYNEDSDSDSELEIDDGSSVANSDNSE